MWVRDLVRQHFRRAAPIFFRRGLQAGALNHSGEVAEAPLRILFSEARILVGHFSLAALRLETRPCVPLIIPPPRGTRPGAEVSLLVMLSIKPEDEERFSNRCANLRGNEPLYLNPTVLQATDFSRESHRSAGNWNGCC